MSSSAYGRKLNPYRRLRDPLGVKGVRESMVNANATTTIDQRQNLLVSFKNLGKDDVIVPGTARLAFTISLKSTDANRTVVQNLGRALVKDTNIMIEGRDIMTITDSDIYYIYSDLWKTSQERDNMHYQGIDTTADRNATKLRVGAGNGVANTADSAIKTAYGNRFYIPLDFELLESHMPYYQSGLREKLQYYLTFNEYSRVVQAAGDPNASYKIENISLEYDVVTEPSLARIINSQYAGRLAILHDRILRHKAIVRNKSDSIWDFDLNLKVRSMKGILFLFEDADAQQCFQRETEAFYNPKITNVEVTVEGKPNQLYSRGMKAYHQWEEARKFFAGGTKRHPGVAEVAKDLGLADVSLADFLTSKYCLWLDMRVTDDDRLHGSGRSVEDAITIQIEKEAEAAGPLNVYIYVIMDAQINFENGRYVEKIS